MKGIAADIEKRVKFIKRLLKKSRAQGIVFGNSGGKDAVLTGALCRLATDNVTGIIMPCGSERGYKEDRDDALLAADFFKFKTIFADLTPTKETLFAELSKQVKISAAASSNISPRLRMTTLYTAAQSLNCLVAGTGNRSEIYLGYFTKWGDGAYDFNPIADLTATEVKEYLKALGAPPVFYTKPPSAGLFEGQTDELDLGMTYSEIDKFLLQGDAPPQIVEKIQGMHNATKHKRTLPPKYKR